MATRPIVPRANGEGSLGVSTKSWGGVFTNELNGANAVDMADFSKATLRQPSTAYTTGAMAYHATLPTGWYLECTTAGETGSGALTITSPTVGGTVSDGTVTWTIRKNASTQDLTAYLPLSGGTMTGDSIWREGYDNILSLKSFPSTGVSGKGGTLSLYGKDSNSPYAGGWMISTGLGTSGTYRYLIGLPDGRLHWGGDFPGNSLDKSAVVAESLGATSGYRKYASGLIEQWGQVSCQSRTNEKIFSFPITFPTAVSSMLAIQYSDKTAGFYTCAIHQSDLSSCIIQYTPAPPIGISFNWRAIGY